MYESFRPVQREIVERERQTEGEMKETNGGKEMRTPCAHEMYLQHAGVLNSSTCMEVIYSHTSIGILIP